MLKKKKNKNGENRERRFEVGRFSKVGRKWGLRIRNLEERGGKRVHSGLFYQPQFGGEKKGIEKSRQ